ncbi:MAG: DUF2062 domain-containing protein [Burkholderiales bacterium]
MPPRFLRRWVPDADQVRRQRWLGAFGRLLERPNLWSLNRDSVAGAVAIGLFAGLVPGPLQMLTAALIAIPLRRNLPVALAVTLYTNPFTIVPIYALAYAYGSLLLGRGLAWHDVEPFEVDWGHLVDSTLRLANWAIALGKPLAVGLVALALTLAVLGYFIVQLGWRVSVRLAWRARRKRREQAPSRRVRSAARLGRPARRASRRRGAP